MSAYDGLDLALPFNVAVIEPPHHEENEMPALAIGAPVYLSELPGRWSVWSQSNESPGAFFILPGDDDARAVGVKYAVVRAKTSRTEAKPQLSLLRTDPHIEGLVK